MLNTQTEIPFINNIFFQELHNLSYNIEHFKQDVMQIQNYQIIQHSAIDNLVTGMPTTFETIIETLQQTIHTIHNVQDAVQTTHEKLTPIQAFAKAECSLAPEFWQK